MISKHLMYALPVSLLLTLSMAVTYAQANCAALIDSQSFVCGFFNQSNNLPPTFDNSSTKICLDFSSNAPNLSPPFTMQAIGLHFGCVCYPTVDAQHTSIQFNSSQDFSCLIHSSDIPLVGGINLGVHGTADDQNLLTGVVVTNDFGGELYAPSCRLAAPGECP